MADWYVNPGLMVLIRQLKALFDGIVIYTIGDTKHAARKSDHNPNKYGRVNAADIMIRGAFTRALAVWLCAWLILDPRTKYVIYNRRIWQDGKWTDYTLSDPHTDHIHVSVFDSAHTNTSEWTLKKREVTMLSIDGRLPELKAGDSDPVAKDAPYWVTRLQRMLKGMGYYGMKIDGDYGDGTVAAVKEWASKTEKLTVNGKTMTLDLWRRLYGIW